ncbi:hypothetical protein [Streptomyces sp. NPDC126503]|uniref:hypothetical protein n=1 Tax=Streptomyces sp. NPDC126503 TaxID=3155315 RepID=UPI0033348E09
MVPSFVRGRGRLLDRTSAARHLGVRDVDFTHLTRTGLLHPATYVHSRFQPRSHAPAVPLHCHGDLQQLLAHPGIDREEVRTTAKGRPSPLARIPTASPSAGGGSLGSLPARADMMCVGEARRPGALGGQYHRAAPLLPLSGDHSPARPVPSRPPGDRGAPGERSPQ